MRGQSALWLEASAIAVEAASSVDGHERGCRIVITLPVDVAA